MAGSQICAGGGPFKDVEVPTNVPIFCMALSLFHVIAEG